ncbi:MAG: hypothetical protein ACYDBT_09170 [Desulfobulbaceae bacterium]
MNREALRRYAAGFFIQTRIQGLFLLIHPNEMAQCITQTSAGMPKDSYDKSSALILSGSLRLPGAIFPRLTSFTLFSYN